MEWIVGPAAAFVGKKAGDITQTCLKGLMKHSVEIQISNKTKNITLRNPRTFFSSGKCSDPPKQVLSPGSSDTCRFPGTYPFWGVAGILVYKAESFTLAIYFCNPPDEIFSMELGLELSPGKAHLGSLKDTYTRMAKGTYSSSRRDIEFDRVILGEYYGTAQLSHGPVKVMAAMSKATNSILKVVLEEEGGCSSSAGRKVGHRISV